MAHFGDLLNVLVKDYGGTKQDLARAWGVRPSAFSRFLAGKVPTIDQCLRLAAVTGTSPTKILRAAGLDSMDITIQDLYGPPAKFEQRKRDLTPIERQFLDRWRSLDGPTRKAFDTLMVKIIASIEQQRSARRHSA